jgi:hypothetical protein
MKSGSFGRLIAGPVGSGKTTACIFELFRRACEQEPAPDGIRYTRFAIVRQTLKQLKDTVLKDIEAWLKGITRYKVSDNTIYIECGDVKSEWLLIPLDDAEDQRRLLSMQLTGAWLSECIEMDVQILSPLAGRCGRYPGASEGGATWFGLIADTNMPSEASDWYKFMEEETPPDWQIFIQPGGMSPHAENLNWLTQTPETLKLPLDHPQRLSQGRAYYERFVRNNSEDWCKRYVHAEFGDDPSGTAVFRTTFKSAFHVIDELLPIPGLPLIIGQDFGRDPWSIICQADHRGRLLVLEEVEGTDTGLEKHVMEGLRPKLMDPRYIGRPVAIVGDPSGVAKGSIYEETSFDALKRMGFMCFPAPTNDIDARLRAVEAWLLRQSNGAAAILFDKKRCPTLIRAMGGGYRYAKLRSGQRKPTPEKNEYSHPSDALQYACLASHGGMVTAITNKLRMRPRRERPRFSAAAWT